MSETRAAVEQLCRRIFDETAAYAIVLFNRDGVIEQWNRGAAELFGYSADEACGRGSDLLFKAEDVAAGVPQHELETAAARGHVQDRRWKQRKDGSWFFAAGMIVALHDEGGSLIGFAKIIRDATSEQLAIEQGRASEGQLRLIIDSIRDYAIYLLNEEGRILSWSRGAQRIKGYTAEEVLGRSFEIFYPPEDVAAGKPRRQLEIAAEKGTYEDESMHVRKDGSRFWAAVVVSAIRREDGELRGFVNLTHDITERRRNHERVAFLAEASRVLAASIDYEETLRQIARIAVPRLADWCAVDLLTEDGASLSRVVVEHVEPAKVELAAALQEKYPPTPNDSGASEAIHQRRTVFVPEVSEEMLRRTARDEEHRRVLQALGLSSAIITPLLARGRVLGTLTLVTSGDRRLAPHDVTVAEDIAARAGIAVQNARLYREAQEANRAKDDFLATVSHELRTPMTAVIGWAKLLRTETDPDTIAEAAGAIERSAAAQAQLIDDILDVARIRTGKLRMHFETVNVADVVQAAVETVRLTADAKDIRLHVQADSGVLPVRGDPQRLQQVVWNLLTNAVKFTPEGGRIDVSLEWVNSTARITVRDTGAGIAPAFLPHLFERFRQAETTQRRGLGGLGLGLSIAEYIVTAHGGSIRAQSAGEGQGATFIVDLPIAIEKSGREPRSPSRSTDEVESLQGVSVLVVEDDADTLLYFRHAFGRAGAVVAAASSVDEALEMFRANEPDVVVSDIAMPEKSGYNLVQAIRQSGSSVPIIAVTASGAMGDRDRALSAGFDVYLRKPVEPRELIHAVRQAVDAAR